MPRVDDWLFGKNLIAVQCTVLAKARLGAFGVHRMFEAPFRAGGLRRRLVAGSTRRYSMMGPIKLVKPFSDC
jgi:hypothetical protein